MNWEHGGKGWRVGRKWGAVEKEEQVGSGRSSCGNVREEEQGKRYFDRESHYGDSEKADTREISKNPQ